MNVPSSLVFGLILSFVSVQSQFPVDVSVSLDGEDITNYPVLIYHDQITYGVSPPKADEFFIKGDLICTSENHLKAQWRSPSGILLKTKHANYRQVESEAGTLPSLSQLSTPNDGDRPRFYLSGYGTVVVNGLWVCQVSIDNSYNSGSNISDEEILENFKYVGIYTRGKGAIDENTISVINLSNIKGDPPSFTLIGDTSGGPPVTHFWSINGTEISNNGPYDISPPEVNKVDTLYLKSVTQVLRETRYRSTLTVTGYLPGLYEYSVKNRAMKSYNTANFTIQALLLTDITAEQIGLNQVLINWTEPADNFTNYELLVNIPGGSNETLSGKPPYIYESTEVGVHTIREMYPSQHLLSPEIMVTVKGYGPLTISISPRTSAFDIISWSLPEFNLPVIKYMVTLTRVTGSGPLQELCPEYEDNRPTITTTATSMSTKLEDFSTYIVNIITIFDVFGGDVEDLTPGMMFKTSSAAPTGVPRDVTAFTASRSIMVTWDTIECIERNGIILRYIVDSDTTGKIMSNRTFSAEGLTPGRQYIFRVAGVNDADTGPFTDTMTITTNEEVPGPVSNLMAFGIFRSVYLTWDSPQYMNGVIISYEVTYRVTNVTLIVNTTDTTFSIPSPLPLTTVSDLSVRAYTKIGYGDTTKIPDQITLDKSIVKNVRVKRLSATAVRVLWNRVAIPEVAGYMVYYSETNRPIEMSVTVDSSTTKVDIEGLLKNMKYHFWVAVIASVNGKEFIGGKSLSPPSLCSSNCEIVISLIFSYLVIMILVTVLLYYLLRKYRLKDTTDSRLSPRRKSYDSS